MAKKVQVKKEEVGKNVSEATKRKKVTEFIALNKSRQEFVPLSGKYIETVNVEPLHLKNNSCQQIFRDILYHAGDKSVLSKEVTTFKSVPVSTPFFRLVRCLETQAKLCRLAGKIERWFEDTKGSGKDFQYRFTGQDSRMFLQNAMYIIDAVKEPTDSAKQTFSLHVFAYFLQLRQAVSIFCKVLNVNLQDLVNLQMYCSNFFRARCLFSSGVSPTV